MAVSIERFHGSGKEEWYIIRVEDDMYLHPDGTWHDSTVGHNGDYPGLYPSREVAQEVLDSVSIEDEEVKRDFAELEVGE